ncbi:Ribose operon repressor [Paenibacillus solanacearum]|uniref:Ribose operon repressor n=1 Tax=Paenibacillus solanacearum TaxID=2048548 RepID=A0A916K5J8_9BACL|nr:LacI family DNA-binding transcriptional regulator [Paenibacillus solanacearum]CAG7629281.1 Ribose operon repressor [Paenibacillus solanacearum]
MATINDVAKRAGVSKGTVSSVFSKKRPISTEVTERVLAAAKELSYFPNQLARSLAIKKTMIVGLKIPISREHAMSGFEVQLINGVIRECSKRGYRVLLDTLPEHDDPIHFAVDPVDGVIMLNPRTNDPRIDRYKLMQTPLVLIGRPDPMDASVCYVDNDNVRIGSQVGQYLIDNGHTSVLFLNASSDMTVAADRKSGLYEAFERSGLSTEQLKVLHYSRKQHGNPTKYGYVSLKHSYGNHEFTAVIADTDRVALGALQATRELGIVIPEQLSIVALSDDPILAQETSPKLTSVELSAELLGSEAAKILLKKIKNIGIVQQKVIDAKLILRESCKTYV